MPSRRRQPSLRSRVGRRRRHCRRRPEGRFLPDAIGTKSAARAVTCGASGYEYVLSAAQPVRWRLISRTATGHGPPVRGSLPDAAPRTATACARDQRAPRPSGARRSRPSPSGAGGLRTPLSSTATCARRTGGTSTRPSAANSHVPGTGLTCTSGLFTGLSRLTALATAGSGCVPVPAA